MRLFRRRCVRTSQRQVFRPSRACLIQLERKVEEMESDTLRSRSFHVIRLQESESHTEEIINRLGTVPLFHRNTSKDCKPTSEFEARQLVTLSEGAGFW